MAKQKIETSIEINEIDVVAYPLVESDHVTFENGMSINEMIKGDVVTPVVTHEETSFKVGKGDSDVSSSIVDSSVGEMIIKGQTYQNILPEPSLRNSMNNGETMQKFNEGYDSVNVVDGVGKHAILKGRTLVNVHQQTLGRYTLNCTRQYAQYNVEVAKNPMMSIGKTYLYILDVIENTANSTATWINSHNTLTNEWYMIQAGKTGRMVFKANFKENANNPWRYNWFEFNEKLDNYTGHIVFTLAIIPYQDGMENWDIPYFEGMQSVKMPVLSTVGKNLFNINNPSYTWESDGNLISTIEENKIKFLGYFSKFKEPYRYEIALKENASYTFSYETFGNLSYEYPEDFCLRIYKDDTLSRTLWRIRGKVGFTLSNGENKVRFDIILNKKWGEGEICEIDGGVQNIQLEESSVKTSYEPYKSNILSVPIENHKGFNGVQDTLDCLTGQVTQRIGEIVFDGSETSWGTSGIQNQTETMVFQINSDSIKTIPHPRGGSLPICDKLPSNNTSTNDTEGILVCQGTDGHGFYIRIKHSKLSTQDVNGLKTYLQSNPITIQYVLETPITKTVDLSSFGNWEKVVLDGSEGWVYQQEYTRFYTPLTNLIKTENYIGKMFCDNNQYIIHRHFGGMQSNDMSITGYYDSTSKYPNENWLYFVNKKVTSADQLKSLLSQNPITVWYQTTTSQANSIKEMLSFSNGHIQLSSGVGEGEYSLIPSIDYEVPTSNSYHMDLMKADTNYTVKSTNPNGACDIGDMKGITIPSNYLWNVPSARKGNMLLVVHGSWTTPMILEGDLTSKALPYFKGIKSSFEDESKIEVLSSNCANLFHPKDVVNNSYWELDVIGKAKLFLSAPRRNAVNMVQREANGNRVTAGVNEVENQIEILPNVKTLRLMGGCFNPTDGWHELIMQNLIVADAKSENNAKKIDYATNITKIPLSSPLRSLPNGVRDEVILDRGNNKVKVIQRIGEQVFDGSSDENWTINQYNPYKDGTHYQVRCWLGSNAIKDGLWLNKQCILSDRLPSTDWELHWNGIGNHGIGGDRENIMITWKRDNAPFSDVATLRAWLSKNPTTVYYELATPVITEIDLDGYPYIYKDGHIFLNSKIAPTTTMKYSINQSHQIASQNGDLIRHEKEINYLYTLIAKYVNVQYESTLLNLDLELSRA